MSKMKWRHGVSYSSSQKRSQTRPLTTKLAVTVLQVLRVVCREDYAMPDLLMQQHTAGGRMLPPSVGVGNAEVVDAFGLTRGRFYREDGVAVFFCPAGTYGESVGLREEACSGVCPAGWYCPTGTVNPFSFACGGPRFYCPEQSGRPLPVDRGHYAVALEFDSQGQPSGYSSQKRCPIGRFCVEGISLPCPPGRFGASQLLTNPFCTGACKAGHFCPEGSHRADQHVCGNASVYCPEGSGAPTLASEGFYTVQDDISGVDRHPWHGIAETRTTQVKCEPGFYCMDGVRRPCPPGTYGDASGLSTPACSGPCDAGYMCGEGATSPTEAVCGGSGEFFCPEGSSSPSLASAGYYTIGEKSTSKSNPSPVADSSFTRTAEVLCEPGYWCSRGLRHPCEPGTFGDVFGMTQRNCSGPCSPGYTCGDVSVSPEERPCGNPSVYCPGGNSEPLAVSVGYYSVRGKGPTTRAGQAVAPVGSYAAQGMLFACPPGRYGASKGLSSPLCSGECSPGFYCPAGSISPKERACGGATLFCPAGSGWPIRVDEGFYTTDYSTAPEQEACPPGYFRNTSFPHGIDPTRGEPSAIVTTIPLPPCHLCPEGTFKAKTGDHPDLCLPCEEHTSESSSARTSCLCRRISGGDMTAEFLYFNTTSAKCQNVTASFRPPAEAILEESIFTRYHQRECEPGHFCVDGVRFPCPAGRFGANARENSPECDGACAEGWYCPEASVSSTEFPCGAANLYCPSGSSAPIFVDPGFYTIGGYGFDVGYESDATVTGYGDDNRAVARRPDEARGAAFRSDVALCPPGWYCTGDGGGVKCPPGLYGSEVGLSDPECSGTCSPGYFCPSGSTSPFEQKCGGTGLYCPAGSSAPIEVSKGYYGVHAGPRGDLLASMDPLNETHSAQVLCEPGFFCEGGLKEACPPGTFLWQYGESSRASCVPCKAGYYCPAQEPPRPSAVSTLVECGSPALFCPAGSVQPTTVGAGFYSVDGGSDGTTSISQVLCEPGHFCREGLKSPCPRGTFGATSGLHDEGCSGLCPAGAACPEGTVNPIPCKEGFYAGGGAVACSPCPGRKAREGERCRHSRSCCV